MPFEEQKGRLLEAPNLRGVIFLVEGNAPLFGVEDGTWDLKKNGGTATRGWSLVDSKKKILEVNMFVLRVCIYIYIEKIEPFVLKVKSWMKPSEMEMQPAKKHSEFTIKHSDKRTGELHVIQGYITGVWLNMVNLLQLMTVSKGCHFWTNRAYKPMTMICV